MKEEVVQAPDSRVHKVTFPWLSGLGALLGVSYLLLVTEPNLVDYYKLPTDWFTWQIKYAVFAGFLLLLLFDLWGYRRQYRRQARDLEHLRTQLADLWQSKKQLQLKAHTYSGHADKLKLFISDKLLNYIEYDEKFLHFKSIAAEVRHNGVISFDKVQTALQQAAELLQPASPQSAKPSQSAQTPASTSAQNSSDIHAALDAMRYLWDLLDLSTADNLALHIGNLLCECEEHYYQMMLNLKNTQALPYDPVYPPQRAAWRALGLVRPEPLPVPEQAADYTFEDSQWYIRLAPARDLLGNENHLVLLLENLLKNAQFFSSKRGYKSAFAPVALTLSEEQGQARLRVYNRGPHILDEDRPNLFQLGFSTRRARAHHGRGLGLYFVNEIVKGYEGRILVHNIHTPQTQYALRLELENDEVITALVDVMVVNGQPQCRRAGGEPSELQTWTLKSPLRSVEVTDTGRRGAASELTQRLADFASKGKQSRFDPAHPEYPHWRLNYQPKRNAHQLSFEPLEIDGVEFEIRLPTAQQRLDSSELDLDHDIDAEVERLDERFRTPVTDAANG